jgi:glutaredoxin
MRIFSRRARRAETLVRVVVYSKPDCHLCDEAKKVLTELQSSLEFDLEVLDIRSDPELYETYREQIPVVFINDRKAFRYRVDPERFRRLLQKGGQLT